MNKNNLNNIENAMKAAYKSQPEKSPNSQWQDNVMSYITNKTSSTALDSYTLALPIGYMFKIALIAIIISITSVSLFFFKQNTTNQTEHQSIYDIGYNNYENTLTMVTKL